MFKKIFIFFLIFSIFTGITYSSLDNQYKKNLNNILETFYSKNEKKYTLSQQKNIYVLLNSKIDTLKTLNNIQRNEVLEYIQLKVAKKISLLVEDLYLDDIVEDVKQSWLTSIYDNENIEELLLYTNDYENIIELITNSLSKYSNNNNNNLEVLIQNIDKKINSENYSNKNFKFFNDINNSLKDVTCDYYNNHENIEASTFWIWEEETAENAYISNDSSAWDEDWWEHFDDWDENSFYIALPYNDFTDGWIRRENSKDIPWYTGEEKNRESIVKNRWIKVEYKWKTAYAQWEDVGPLLSNDFDYVFWYWKSNNDFSLKAWIDLSPDLSDYLWFNWSWKVDWKFVSSYCIPDWKRTETITESNINWY